MQRSLTESRRQPWLGFMRAGRKKQARQVAGSWRRGRHASSARLMNTPAHNAPRLKAVQVVDLVRGRRVQPSAEVRRQMPDPVVMPIVPNTSTAAGRPPAVQKGDPRQATAALGRPGPAEGSGSRPCLFQGNPASWRSLDNHPTHGRDRALVSAKF